MAIKAHDVAAYILMRKGADIDTYSLEKLVYYAQAWSLVWERHALFGDRIEAWERGPVVPSLFAAHVGKRTVASIPEGDPSRLGSHDRETIDAVVDFYSRLDGNELSALTHREDPWVSARNGKAPDAPSNTEITRSVMIGYYGHLQTHGKKLPEALMRGIKLLLTVPEDRAGQLFEKSNTKVDALFPE